jgi:hypothetical protein
MMTVDYLEIVAVPSDYERLVTAGPLDIANKPGEVPLAHPVGIAGMSGQLVDWNTRYLALNSFF